MNVLVTGATGAIGSELSRQLVSCGHAVTLAARNDARLADLSATLGHPAALSADLTDPAAAQRMVRQAWEQCDGLDGLAHCVGSTLVKPLHLTSDAEALAQLQVNYLSAFHTLRALVSLALKNRRPLSAVLVSSVVASSGFPNHEAVSASKAAVAALALSTAASYASRGIRVNVVAPGLTRSALTSRFIASPEAEARLAGSIPLGRIGEPADPAAVIAFLLSEHSAYLTGQVITVAGGQGTLQLPPRVA